MKYHTKQLIKHCMTRPEVWTAISQNIRFSSNHQIAEVSFKVKGLRAIKKTDGWPIWAKAVAMLRRKQDIGVGDVVERWARVTGAKWIVKTSRINCGCEGRGVKWNKEFPF